MFESKKKIIYCTTTSLKALNESLLETYCNCMKYSKQILGSLLVKLQTYMTSLHILSEYISQLDMLLSFAYYSSTVSSIMCKPRFVDHKAGPIVFTESKHPILEQISLHNIISNTISIYQTRNLHIIYGPNASGKSTYIKQCALLTIMAHIGCFIPAQYASLKLIKQIFTRLSNNDNILLNQSSYFNECKDMNYILNNCNQSSLIIIDELGRSTSTIDAFAFAFSCAEYLLKKQSYTLFVTHFNLNKLKIYPNVVINKFKMNIDENKIQYSYKLYQEEEQQQQQQQQQEHEYGIIMAEMTGFPNNIINDANVIVNKIKTLNIEPNNNLPRSDLENALIMKEHTQVIRTNQNLTRQQIIDVIFALKQTIQQ
eukprot:167554_1